MFSSGALLTSALTDADAIVLFCAGLREKGSHPKVLRFYLEVQCYRMPRELFS